MTDCVPWTGRLNPEGYAVRSKGKRDVYVHREIYELTVDPIPDGHDVHHDCGSKDCIEPRHLRAMSHGEHTSKHFRCQKHPDSPRREWRGISACVECCRERQRRWNAENRERKNAHNRAYRARRTALRGEKP